MTFPILIVFAFVLGFVATRVGLPPLVGYLVAGFVFNAMGFEASENINQVADLGVTLLLFSIGLKLRLKTLTKPEVWAGASLHLLITAAFIGAAIFLFSQTGFARFTGLDLQTSLLLAFTLSFSSTVFAVKVFEERGEMASYHGRTAIGILIMQDIFAVLFIAVSTGKTPSPWALAIPLALFAGRPILYGFMDRCGHRELLLLFAMCVALGVGYGGFEWVSLKGDLGVLIMGMLLAPHAKSEELAKVLLSFKDLFLVAFFLSIGLTGLPTLQSLGTAAILVVILPAKVILYFFLLTRFKLRARTSLLVSLSLANYSEFGLIVCAIGVKNGWIGSEWLIIEAIALSITFILASPLNTHAHNIYRRFATQLKKYETERRLPDDEPIDAVDAEVLIFGMGRIGKIAYDNMRERYGQRVLGLDYDPDVVQKNRADGREVIQDDATDSDFWEKIRPGKVQLVILTMQSHESNMYSVERLNEINYNGLIAATAHFDDQVAELEEAGVHAAFNLFAEAGNGFVNDVCKRLHVCLLDGGAP